MNSKIPGTSISQEIPRDLEAHIFLTIIIKTQPSGLTLHPHPFQSQLKKGPKPFYFIGHLAFTKYSISSVGPIQPHHTPPTHTHTSHSMLQLNTLPNLLSLTPLNKHKAASGKLRFSSVKHVWLLLTCPVSWGSGVQLPQFYPSYIPS